MSHPFDVTLKEIVQSHAADYARAFGLPTAEPITPLNVDLSTLSAATDVVLGFGDPLALIVDLNFQSGPDRDLDPRVLLYAAALYYRFGVPVRSKVILLRPAARSPHVFGTVAFSSGQTRLEFRYETIRLWEQPVADYLTAGVGVLPLAPLCGMPANVPLEDAVSAAVREIDRRLTAELPPTEAAELMTAAYFMTGARLSFDVARQIFRGVVRMIESSTYQGVLEEGRVVGEQQGTIRGVRMIILRQGRNKFGPIDPATEAALNAVADLDRLQRMADVVLTASSWDELLATP